MRIGELARQVGVSTDTVRFYERSGWLPRASRRDNDYRDYGEPDVEHLRLLIELRRLEVPLEHAGKIASWCHSGHCTDTTAELPGLIAERRADITNRIAGLRALDARLAGLERHLTRPRRELQMVDQGPCCEAADAIVGSAEGGRSCCAPAIAGPLGRPQTKFSKRRLRGTDKTGDQPITSVRPDTATRPHA